MQTGDPSTAPPSGPRGPGDDRVDQVVDDVAARLHLPDEVRDVLAGLLTRWTSGYSPTLLPVGPVSQLFELEEPPARMTPPPELSGLPTGTMDPTPLPALERGSPFDGGGPAGETQPIDITQIVSTPPPAPSVTRQPVSGTSGGQGLTWSDGNRPAPGANGLDLGDQYIDVAPIGAGGMGEVRRVLDKDFNRLLALKVVRPELAKSRRVVSRFVAEAQVTGQLQHPGIVPVHSMGRLPDGRHYFTMREVRGREFGHVITEVHQNRLPGIWRATPSGWTFRRLVQAFHQVCETIAYAHSMGVIHRDIKPENVVVGDYGVVYVLDWGLARIVGSPIEDEGPRIVTERSRDSSKDTLVGTVAGTPAYMPIEQATGDRARQGPHSDVYALGGMLYEILCGHPPYTAPDADETLRQVLAGPPDPPDEGPEIPEVLRQICQKAMARQPEQRYPTAAELSQEVGSWLEGAQRRDQALARLEQARERDRNIQRLLARAAARREEAERLLGQVKPTAPIEEKRVAWQHLEEARRLEHGAEVLEAVVTQLAGAALAQDPELPEAHAFLADHYHRVHAIAEARGETASADRYKILLQAHDAGRYQKYIAGKGALTLHTDQPGAEVQIFRYVEQDRRMVAETYGKRLQTPLRQVELPMGSYLLVITRPGCVPVRYPVHVRRDEHWDGVPPGASEPMPIALPAVDEIGDDEVYVPPGWFWAGEHPDAPKMPRERVWLDAFVMRRFPVTNRVYLEFLNELQRGWRQDEAARYAPALDVAAFGRDRPLYQLDRSGNYGLADGLPTGAMEWPVVLVDWSSAAAYASWLSARDGRQWFLPRELEWEKAARGVDGRVYPWGHWLDPTWCCMVESHAWTPEPAPVDAYPTDSSPWGVQGLAGNVHEWCRDRFRSIGPLVVDGRLPSERDVATAGPKYRVLRGGAWSSRAEECRATWRTGLVEGQKLPDVGFRLARPLGKFTPVKGSRLIRRATSSSG